MIERETERQIGNQTTDGTIKSYTCDMEYDIILPTIGNDRVKQIGIGEIEGGYYGNRNHFKARNNTSV